MPIRKIFSIPIALAGLFALIIFFLFSLRANAPGENMDRLPRETENKKISKCGMESCHGLDVKCGPNIPEMCTEQYQLGDACRKYARCEILEGKCQLAQSPDFDECKNCVKKCENQFAADSSRKVWECESGCHMKINGGEIPELE